MSIVVVVGDVDVTVVVPEGVTYKMFSAKSKFVPVTVIT